MFNYAQIDLQTNVVEGISQLSEEIIADHLISIGDSDVELGSTYNYDTQSFTPPIPEPVESQLTLAEMQAQTLLNTELLLIYKEIGM